MPRLGTVQVDHRDAAERLRTQPGVWLPVGEYRTRDSANATAKAIRTGHWLNGNNNPSPYTAGEYEADTEMTEYGFRVLARYQGAKEQREADTAAA